MNTPRDCILFHNNGKLDRRAFTMMGLSAKEGTKEHIGFFGTGFKYALAVLIREGHTVIIINGNMHYSFETRKDTFRGKEIETIMCHSCEYSSGVGEVMVHINEPFELPFTTHLGATWEMWQAYRELTTNTQDEDNGTVQYIENASEYMRKHKGAPGVFIYVIGDAFREVHELRNKYFLPPETKTVAKCHSLRAIPKLPIHDNVVYYKGMYTGTKMNRQSYFTYDYITKQELTEDRTLRNLYFIDTPILEIWCEEMSYDQLVQYLPAIARDDKLMEHHLSAGSYQDMSDAFKEAIIYLDTHRKPIPMWARRLYDRSKPMEDRLDKHKLNKLENKMLTRAIKMLGHHGAIIDPKKVVICKSLPDNLLGMIEYEKGDESNIFISSECFSRGMLTLIGTLFEEWIHITKRHDDNTREMQNYLIDRCASMMEVIYTLLHEDD